MIKRSSVHTPAYRGRFAPSPTGPLHLGSLYCAVYGWLHARQHQGEWLIRIEDIDPPREEQGARELILRGLQVHDLCWDGLPQQQLPRITAYREAVQQLLDDDQAYYCTCSRRQLREQGGHRLEACINTRRAPIEPAAIRFRMQAAPIHFHDLALGWLDSAALQVDDFVLWRKDDLPAYQLAVVVDDAWQGITHVVRGYDLLDSTPGQICLHEALHSQPPAWLHHPVLGANGDKLSKQTGAEPIDLTRPQENLIMVLKLLGMSPEPGLQAATPDQILQWARLQPAPELTSKPHMIEL